MPEVWADHSEPFHFRIAPLLPTAQTLLASVPHTPKRNSVVPEVWVVHAEPFHFRILPLSPTAHALLSSLAHTP